MEKLQFNESHTLDVTHLFSKGGKNFQAKASGRRGTARFYGQLDIIEKFAHFNGIEWQKYDKRVKTEQFNEDTMDKLKRKMQESFENFLVSFDDFKQVRLNEV